jgi:hypothetical protein
MRISQIWFVAFVSASLPGSATASETSYLCIGDLSTGFALESGIWKTVNFSVSDAKLIVKPASIEESRGGEYQYTVTRIGQDTPFHFCEKPLVEGVIVCSGRRTSFVLDTANLRYQEYYGIGYVHGDLPGNTPSITIGKCSKF